MDRGIEQHELMQCLRGLLTILNTGLMCSIASLTPIWSASNKVKLDLLPKANVFHSSCELKPYFHSWHPSLSDKH